MSEWIMTYRGVVYPWHCDHIGHMNVMWYTGKFDEACWQLLSQLGLTPSRFAQDGTGMAAVEQHIQYKRELHAGDAVTIQSALVGSEGQVDPHAAQDDRRHERRSGRDDRCRRRSHRRHDQEGNLAPRQRAGACPEDERRGTRSISKHGRVVARASRRPCHWPVAHSSPVLA